MAHIAGPRESRESFWRRHIASCESSGMSAAGYCRAQRISVSGYHWWKGELKRRDARAAQEVTVMTPHFAEVRLAPAEADDTPLIEMALAGNRRVGVRPGFDAATLAEVVRVLEGLEC